MKDIINRVSTHLFDLFPGLAKAVPEFMSESQKKPMVADGPIKYHIITFQFTWGDNMKYI